MITELERRLLILAPVGKDAVLVQTLLRREGIACHVCLSMRELAHELRQGAAGVIIAEECLIDPASDLVQAVAHQPPWSDLPVLVLTRVGASSAIVEQAVATLGNVTLLERPVRIAALTSAAQTAVRARHRQYELRAHLEERASADRRKDEFLATLAHELRNPMAPIRSSLDLLRLRDHEPPPRELLETMDRQLSHMMRLIDDLMDVSRVTRGTIQLRFEPTPLREVIDAAVNMSRPQIDAAGHRLTIVLPPQPMVVDADAVRLAQVFANLLNNAAKYTDRGGAIRLEADVTGGRAEVRVSDNGMGIAPEALGQLFTMFFQAVPARRGPGGLGVGLTLARSLVQMHRGEITAHSDGPGRGSTFTVRLPLSERPAAGVPAPPVLTAPLLRKMPRVLVVDDNEDAANTLATLLQLLGAEVRVAHDGQAALAAYEQFRPQAMFLDIGMPGMDGYEVADRLRARRDAEDTLLIALTGWGQERDQRRSQAAGFTHHLVKPADASRLRAVLASLAA